MEYVAYKAVEFITDNQNNDWFLYVNPTVPHSPGKKGSPSTWVHHIMYLHAHP